MATTRSVISYIMLFTKMRNEQMFAEIADLDQGSEAIEERARSHLGMIKPNEHFYRIVTESVSPK